MKKKGKELTPHIGIFGKRNMGKSSIINALAGQKLSIVSDKPGTTTDPVKKTIEIKNIGPVILIDTAGIDDTGFLGKQRIEKTLKILDEIDLAILVVENCKTEDFDEKLIKLFKKNTLPYFIISNKNDIHNCGIDKAEILEKKHNTTTLLFSATKFTSEEREKIFDTIKKLLPESSYKKKSLLADLISQGDIVVLVTPIDEEAPEGRLILPQVQTIRDILDNDAIAVVTKERELDITLKRIPNPTLVITDSQVFNKVAATVPEYIPMTSFSILLARQKGDFEAYIKGTPYISKLKDGDKVLLLESCTHQVSCDDIGRIKIPRWIRNFTGKQLEFEVVSGLDSLPNIKQYAMVIQCGGCVVTHKQLKSRLKRAIKENIPVSNYGMTIAYVHGIFPRAVKPFLKTAEDKSIYL